ncbi:MAG: TetR/AcrR family transcriptional regulator [Planctomycetota bacterium]
MPRGRPRTFDEHHALDAAVEVFTRLGYDGANIAALCRATGLAPQSLYNTFGDKHTLYCRAMERYGETANLPIMRALEDEDDPINALRKFVLAWRRHIGATERDGCLFTITLAAADRERVPRAPEIAAHFTSRLRSTLAHRAREASAAGHLPPGSDPDRLADTLLTLAFGVAVAGRGGIPATLIDHAVHQGLALIGIEEKPVTRSGGARRRR